tara:strand:- start:476 stop:688 length:213 start_codon:yes stop_codon:yes gene_type:complete
MSDSQNNQVQDQDTSHHEGLVRRFYPQAYIKKIGLNSALKAFTKAFIEGGEQGLKTHLLEVKAKAKLLEG